jgi:hypothetical protein
LHLTTGQNSAETVIAQRRSARVRGRVFKGLLALLSIGVIYAVTVLWHRDTTRMRMAEERLVPFAGALQAVVDTTGRLPLRLPRTGPNGTALPVADITLVGIEDISLLRGFDGPVLVGYSRPVGLALRPNGYAALIYDAGQSSVRWLPRPEFGKLKHAQDVWLEQRRRELLEYGPRLP